MSTNYIHTEIVHNFEAAREIVPVVMKLTQPKNVLDIGCGTGTWLKIFEDNGIQDYMGVDGEYVNKSMMKVPPEKFKPADLTKPLELNRKFDLIVSLEVAEHLSEEAADTFVESIVRHGNCVLFSAAIPQQGGQHHVNEQWPEYWESKFNRHGFYFHDIIRPLIWDNEKIDFWYRQNIFLLKKEKPTQNQFAGLSIVHPQLHIQRVRQEEEYRESLIQGKQGLRLSFNIFLNAILFKAKNLLKF